MSRQFEAALRKLVDDEQYRRQVKSDPQRIANDFQFTTAELSMLAAVGQTHNDAAAGTRVRMHGGGCSCSSGTPSDRRLKTGIEHIATLPSGIRLHRFKYRWSETEYVGVLAQEICEIVPHAVMQGCDGFLRVNYQALGLAMLPYATWNAGVNSASAVAVAA